VLLPPSTHLSLELDWVAREPNTGSYDTEMIHYHHREIEEFVGQTSLARQSIGRTCTDSTSTKLILISITLKQSSGENMNTFIKEKNLILTIV
jgi:hypothetical protein